MRRREPEVNVTGMRVLPCVWQEIVSISLSWCRTTHNCFCFITKLACASPPPSQDKSLSACRLMEQHLYTMSKEREREQQQIVGMREAWERGKQELLLVNVERERLRQMLIKQQQQQQQQQQMKQHQQMHQMQQHQQERGGEAPAVRLGGGGGKEREGMPGAGSSTAVPAPAAGGGGVGPEIAVAEEVGWSRPAGAMAPQESAATAEASAVVGVGETAAEAARPVAVHGTTHAASAAAALSLPSHQAEHSSAGAAAPAPAAGAAGAAAGAAAAAAAGASTAGAGAVVAGWVGDLPTSPAATGSSLPVPVLRGQGRQAEGGGWFRTQLESEDGSGSEEGGGEGDGRERARAERYKREWSALRGAMDAAVERQREMQREHEARMREIEGVKERLKVQADRYLVEIRHLESTLSKVGGGGKGGGGGGEEWEEG